MLGGNFDALGPGGNNSLSNIAGHVGVGAASSLAGAATRSAIDGSSFGDNVRAGLPDVIGQVLGSALARTFQRMVGAKKPVGAPENLIPERFYFNAAVYEAYSNPVISRGITIGEFSSSKLGGYGVSMGPDASDPGLVPESGSSVSLRQFSLPNLTMDLADLRTSQLQIPDQEMSSALTSYFRRNAGSLTLEGSISFMRDNFQNRYVNSEALNFYVNAFNDGNDYDVVVTRESNSSDLVDTYRRAVSSFADTSVGAAVVGYTDVGFGNRAAFEQLKANHGDAVLIGEISALATAAFSGGKVVGKLASGTIEYTPVIAGRYIFEEVPAPRGTVGSSELGNALSTLGARPVGRNLHTLDEFGPGTGFSAVYDIETRTFLAYPSGDARLLSGEVPVNLVDKYGGHRAVNNVLTGLLGRNSNNRAGFSMVMDGSGNLRVGWNSRTINEANPNFSSRTVPLEAQQQILDAITQHTGRRAY